MTPTTSPCGLLLIDKPAGPTSHDVVGWVRWALRTKAVGHCGTLDPAATGLLVVCVGTATRLAQYFTAEDKTYEATFVLGESYDTADAEGCLLERATVPQTIEDTARDTLLKMIGLRQLPPPVYSAIRIDGKRAHERVRNGEKLELAPRPMDLRSIVDVSVENKGAVVEVHATLEVSKGSYIRSIAVELGRRLGVPAHLKRLRRTASGALTVGDPNAVTGLLAHALEAKSERPPPWRIRTSLDDSEQCCDVLRRKLALPSHYLPFPVVDAGRPPFTEALERLVQGQKLSVHRPPGDALLQEVSRQNTRFSVMGTLSERRILAIVSQRSNERGEVLVPERVVELGPSA